MESTVIVDMQGRLPGIGPWGNHRFATERTRPECKSRVNEPGTNSENCLAPGFFCWWDSYYVSGSSARMLLLLRQIAAIDRRFMEEQSKVASQFQIRSSPPPDQPRSSSNAPSVSRCGRVYSIQSHKRDDRRQPQRYRLPVSAGGAWRACGIRAVCGYWSGGCFRGYMAAAGHHLPGGRRQRITAIDGAATARWSSPTA